MKTLILKSFVLLIFIVACNTISENDKPKNNEGISAKTAEIKIPDKYDASTAEISLPHSFTDSIRTYFSNLETEDIFQFYVQKGNIYKTTSTLRISDSRGNLLYKTEFKTSSLINGYALCEIKNPKQMESYLYKRASQMLDESSFQFISKDELEEKYPTTANPDDFVDYKTYMECKTENRPLFCIGLEEETLTWIGFSSTSKKVKDIIYCC